MGAVLLQPAIQRGSLQPDNDDSMAPVLVPEPLEVLVAELAGHPGPTAFDHTFVWALVFTAIAAIPAVRIPTRRPAFEQASAEPEQTEAAIG